MKSRKQNLTKGIPERQCNQESSGAWKILWRLLAITLCAIILVGLILLLMLVVNRKTNTEAKRIWTAWLTFFCWGLLGCGLSMLILVYGVRGIFLLVSRKRTSSLHLLHLMEHLLSREQWELASSTHELSSEDRQKASPSPKLFLYSNSTDCKPPSKKQWRTNMIIQWWTTRFHIYLRDSSSYFIFAGIAIGTLIAFVVIFGSPPPSDAVPPNPLMSPTWHVVLWIIIVFLCALAITLLLKQWVLNICHSYYERTVLLSRLRNAALSEHIRRLLHHQAAHFLSLMATSDHQGGDPPTLLHSNNNETFFPSDATGEILASHVLNEGNDSDSKKTQDYQQERPAHSDHDKDDTVVDIVDFAQKDTHNEKETEMKPSESTSNATKTKKQKENMSLSVTWKTAVRYCEWLFAPTIVDFADANAAQLLASNSRYSDLFSANLMGNHHAIRFHHLLQYLKEPACCLLDNVSLDHENRFEKPTSVLNVSRPSTDNGSDLNEKRRLSMATQRPSLSTNFTTHHALNIDESDDDDSEEDTESSPLTYSLFLSRRHVERTHRHAHHGHESNEWLKTVLQVQQIPDMVNTSLERKETIIEDICSANNSTKGNNGSGSMKSESTSKESENIDINKMTTADNMKTSRHTQHVTNDHRLSPYWTPSTQEIEGEARRLFNIFYKFHQWQTKQQQQFSVANKTVEDNKDSTFPISRDNVDESRTLSIKFFRQWGPRWLSQWFCQRVDVTRSGNVDESHLVRFLMVDVHSERHWLLHQGIYELRALIRQLNRLLSWISVILSLVLLLLLFGFNVQQVLLSFSATLVAYGFIFRTAFSDWLNSVLFLFVVHPFNVGDRIHLMDNTNLVVDKMYFLSTVFVQWDGQRVFIPNPVLLAKPLSNIQRSQVKSETLTVEFHQSVTAVQLKDFEKGLNDFFRKHARHFDPKSFAFNCTGMENAQRLIYTISYRGWDAWQLHAPHFYRRAHLLMEIRRLMQVLRMPSFSKPPIPILMLKSGESTGNI